MDSTDQTLQQPLPEQQGQPEQHKHDDVTLPKPSALPSSASLPLRTTSSTPVSSTGLFSPAPRHLRDHPITSFSESSSPAPAAASVSFLHPLQNFRVRETHKALIDSDTITGRKMINQYEVIEEIGRGMHGKVKLARNVATGDNVAIKIIPRFSKKRRLGKLTARMPEDKTKKEIAILKKIRHPNVVALLEIIDDPELKKIYMILEHVELGEVVWRKKGVPYVFLYERRRAERDIKGEPKTAEEVQYDQYLERRMALKNYKRAKMAEQMQAAPAEFWSVEHGAADEHSSVSRVSSKYDVAGSEGRESGAASPAGLSHSSRRDSVALSGQAPSELEEDVLWGDDLQTPGPLTANNDPYDAVDGGMFPDDGPCLRERSPSMADSIMSHMSSIDFNPQDPDPFADDYSYVPCFTFDQARSAFRDTVLGLEYLHYQGVVHRDIKPANLLWSKDHRVKISDFGVSYFGRPNRDGEPEDIVTESEARDFDDDLELAKTVGTPAFFAPELCYTDIEKEQPKVSEQIDVWSLGVTLYCLIFARIPFLAEDEFQMFKKIATEDVYIPRVRLAPVNPTTSPDTQNLVFRQNVRPYRDDGDIIYEDVDDELYDLMSKMLIKNPEKRIRLRDIKRHPWVLRGISNTIGWLDDTDPSRPHDGRKIQVDERDVSSAVVPLTFLEKARSAVRKAVGKVINPLGERPDVKSRRRATSSANSSVNEAAFRSIPATPLYHAERRTQFHDDLFGRGLPMSPAMDNVSIIATVTGSEPDIYDPLATVSASEAPHVRAHRHGLSEASLQDMQAGAARLWHRPTASHESTGSGASRSHSNEKFGLFNGADRGVASVGLGKPVLAGPARGLASPLPLRPAETDRERLAGGHESSLSSSPMSRYEHFNPGSEPVSYQESILSRSQARSRAESGTSVRAQAAQSSNSNVQALSFGPKVADKQPNPPCETRPKSAISEALAAATAERPQQPLRGITATTVQSSSTESIEACVGTPLTCPSEATSPVGTTHPGKNTSDRMLAFQSDPSLPALLSGASSVSADVESEILGHLDVTNNQTPLLQTTDSLTPPALMKESEAGFPLDAVLASPTTLDGAPVAMQLATETAAPSVNNDADAGDVDEDDDGSDDGFLQMAKSKNHKTLGANPPAPRRPPFEARRRDTAISNISTASDETAKRVVFYD
ncbi:hypothetical protein VHEMI01912 [[Torrubiella] hemipterigena]|uniref:non-specific serine/threonine protein kinase n=1 Tax=[Torrubiella] hemipterigena TaxID=1531966 RepID=A0A0A1SUA5_9HYPO|nr:hypothetical protein VHEMI01912 [[Torrubiella] hemipterigena]